MGSELDARGSRAARNEALFREVNERMKSIVQTVSPSSVLNEFVCECPNPDCAERIELTLDEYERIRNEPTWFAVRPGHEAPDVERTIEQHERYLAVEKVGKAAEVAAHLDPRS